MEDDEEILWMPRNKRSRFLPLADNSGGGVGAWLSAGDSGAPVLGSRDTDMLVPR
jgi:hypothetical protein